GPSHDPGQADALFRSIAQSVIDHRQDHPLFLYLAAKPDRLADWLTMLQPVLANINGLERREMIADAARGPAGLSRVLIAMTEEYLARSPEIDWASLGISYERTDPRQKLRYLAAHASVLEGVDPMVFVRALNDLIARNPDRVERWAHRIGNAE